MQGLTMSCGVLTMNWWGVFPWIKPIKNRGSIWFDHELLGFMLNPQKCCIFDAKKHVSSSVWSDESESFSMLAIIRTFSSLPWSSSSSSSSSSWPAGSLCSLSSSWSPSEKWSLPSMPWSRVWTPRGCFSSCEYFFCRFQRHFSHK